MVNALIMIYTIVVISGIVVLLDWLGQRKDRRSKQPKLSFLIQRESTPCVSVPPCLRVGNSSVASMLRSETASNSWISSALSRNVAAPINSSICFGFRAPTIVAVIAGCRSVQAIATSPGSAPMLRTNRAQTLGEC